MSLTIYSNIMSMMGRRAINETQKRLDCSLRRLASGLRINSASDDAAGLALSSKIDAHVKSLYCAKRNTNDGVSMTQVASHALGEVSNILQRMRELAVQAASETISDQDRDLISEEFNQLVAEIDRIGGVTEFNGKKLLDGTLGTVSLQVGINQGETLDFTIDEVTARTLGFVSEGRINSYTSNSQASPFMTALNDGGYIVTWASDGQDGSGNGVFAQRYDANGNPVGNEFQVNTYTTNAQDGPSVEPLANGGFVVVWHSNGQDGSGWGVYGQRFDSNGNKVGTEFQINVYNYSSQRGPKAAALNDGGFVVTWQSMEQDGSGYAVYAQRYDSNGIKVGTEFQVNTYTSGVQNRQDITTLSDGGFVITWGSFWQDGSSFGIAAQRFDSSGNKVGSEFTVNTYTANSQNLPSIASLSDGGFVISWVSDGQDGDGNGIFAQRFDSSGNKVGSESQVNTYTTGSQWDPLVTSLSDGSYVIMWESNGQDGSGNGIYAQRYYANGNPAGNEFKVNTYTSGSQMWSAAASPGNGGFVMTWQSDGQDGGTYGIYGQKFDSDGNAVDYSRMSSVDIARTQIEKIDTALSYVNNVNSELGAVQNRLDSVINNQNIQIESLSAASSRIKDADFAEETAIMVKNQIIQEAGIAVLAQANLMPRIALQLLIPA